MRDASLTLLRHIASTVSESVEYDVKKILTLTEPSRRRSSFALNSQQLLPYLPQCAECLEGGLIPHIIQEEMSFLASRISHFLTVHARTIGGVYNEDAGVWGNFIVWMTLDIYAGLMALVEGESLSVDGQMRSSSNSLQTPQLQRKMERLRQFFDAEKSPFFRSGKLLEWENYMKSDSFSEAAFQVFQEDPQDQHTPRESTKKTFTTLFQQHVLPVIHDLTTTPLNNTALDSFADLECVGRAEFPFNALSPGYDAVSAAAAAVSVVSSALRRLASWGESHCTVHSGHHAAEVVNELLTSAEHLIEVVPWMVEQLEASEEAAMDTGNTTTSLSGVWSSFSSSFSSDCCGYRYHLCHSPRTKLVLHGLVVGAVEVRVEPVHHNQTHFRSGVDGDRASPPSTLLVTPSSAKRSLTLSSSTRENYRHHQTEVYVIPSQAAQRMEVVLLMESLPDSEDRLLAVVNRARREVPTGGWMLVLVQGSVPKPLWRVLERFDSVRADSVKMVVLSQVGTRVMDQLSERLGCIVNFSCTSVEELRVVQCTPGLGEVERGGTSGLTVGVLLHQLDQVEGDCGWRVERHARYAVVVDVQPPFAVTVPHNSMWLCDSTSSSSSLTSTETESTSRSISMNSVSSDTASLPEAPLPFYTLCTVLISHGTPALLRETLQCFGWVQRRLVLSLALPTAFRGRVPHLLPSGSTPPGHSTRAVVPALQYRLWTQLHPAKYEAGATAQVAEAPLMELVHSSLQRYEKVCRDHNPSGEEPTETGYTAEQKQRAVGVPAWELQSAYLTVARCLDDLLDTVVLTSSDGRGKEWRFSGMVE